jgi:hypothetical protein
MGARGIWIGCLTLLALQGCEALEAAFEGAFHASHPEGYLVYEPQEDTLRLVEIYAGLHATNDERAVAALSEFLAGRRVYPPEGGFPSCDLDQAAEPMEGPDVQDRSDRFVAHLAQRANVRERGMYQGELGELGIWRMTEFGPAGEVLAEINRLSSEAVFEKLSKPREEGAEEFLLWRDAESRDLWLARARAGGPWVSLDGSRLVVDMPLSPAGEVLALREIVQESEDEEIPWFLAKVWRVEHSPGGVRLWLGSAESPRLSFGVGDLEEAELPERDAGLVEAVRQAGLELGAMDSIRGVRERHGLPRPKVPEPGLALAVVAPQDREGLSVRKLRWWGESQSPPLTVVAPLKHFQVQEAEASIGAYGEPAISFLVASDDLAEFTEFTEQQVDRRVAFVVVGKVVSAPTIAEPLRGWGTLSGNFGVAVRDEILGHLRAR